MEKPTGKPPIMKYFKYDHLPEGPLRNVSKKFCVVAEQLNNAIDPSPEKSAGLRKLLEAKDCFVRASL